MTSCFASYIQETQVEPCVNVEESSSIYQPWIVGRRWVRGATRLGRYIAARTDCKVAKCKLAVGTESVTDQAMYDTSERQLRLT